MSQAIERWVDALSRGSFAVDVLDLRMIVERNDRTGSGTFKAIVGEDGLRYWVKPLNNPQGALVPVTDYLVGRLGALIGAPVCDVAIVKIPDELAGEEYRTGLPLEAGYACGSHDVDGVLEKRELAHGSDDDNARRHAGIHALYDWCWGSDDQWLYATTAENRIYSHDHGHFLPGGPSWSASSLVAAVDQPHRQGTPAADVSPEALDEFADSLSRLDQKTIADPLGCALATWGACLSMEQMATLGWFLDKRAPQVAARLRQQASDLRGGRAT